MRPTTVQPNRMANRTKRLAEDMLVPYTNALSQTLKMGKNEKQRQTVSDNDYPKYRPHQHLHKHHKTDKPTN